MNRILAAILIASFAFPALAATVYTDDTSAAAGDVLRVNKIAAGTENESAPANGVITNVVSTKTHGIGLNLFGVKGFSVFVEATGGAMTAGGKLTAYLYNPVTTRWTPAPDLDLIVGAVQYQAFAGFNVTSDFARIIYLPVTGVGRAVTIYIVGRPAPSILRAGGIPSVTLFAGN